MAPTRPSNSLQSGLVPLTPVRKRVRKRFTPEKKIRVAEIRRAGACQTCRRKKIACHPDHTRDSSAGITSSSPALSTNPQTTSATLISHSLANLLDIDDHEPTTQLSASACELGWSTGGFGDVEQAGLAQQAFESAESGGLKGLPESLGISDGTAFDMTLLSAHEDVIQSSDLFQSVCDEIDWTQFDGFDGGHQFKLTHDPHTTGEAQSNPKFISSTGQFNSLNIPPSKALRPQDHNKAMHKTTVDEQEVSYITTGDGHMSKIQERTTGYGVGCESLLAAQENSMLSPSANRGSQGRKRRVKQSSTGWIASPKRPRHSRENPHTMTLLGSPPEAETSRAPGYIAGSTFTKERVGDKHREKYLIFRDAPQSVSGDNLASTSESNAHNLSASIASHVSNDVDFTSIAIDGTEADNGPISNFGYLDCSQDPFSSQVNDTQLPFHIQQDISTQLSAPHDGMAYLPRQNIPSTLMPPNSSQSYSPPPGGFSFFSATPSSRSSMRMPNLSYTPSTAGTNKSQSLAVTPASNPKSYQHTVNEVELRDPVCRKIDFSADVHVRIENGTVDDLIEVD